VPSLNKKFFQFFGAAAIPERKLIGVFVALLFCLPRSCLKQLLGLRDGSNSLAETTLKL
jgi:hypothetical protein